MKKSIILAALLSTALFNSSAIANDSALKTYLTVAMAAGLCRGNIVMQEYVISTDNAVKASILVEINENLAKKFGQKSIAEFGKWCDLMIDMNTKNMAALN